MVKAVQPQSDSAKWLQALSVDSHQDAWAGSAILIGKLAWLPANSRHYERQDPCPKSDSQSVASVNQLLNSKNTVLLVQKPVKCSF